MWACPHAAGGRAGQGSRDPCGVKGQYPLLVELLTSDIALFNSLTVDGLPLAARTLARRHPGLFLFVSSMRVDTGTRSPRPPGITYSFLSPAITAPGNGV
jgi:hypothetical protein